MAKIDDSVKKKVPELRFKGFTDEWEQRKLGDEVRIVMGQSPNSENYTDDPNDYILVQGNADMKNGRVLPRVWTTQVTKQAEKDDLILSVRAPVGDIGKTAYDVVIGRGVAAIKGNEFIFQSLGKMKSDGYWTRYSTGSTFESINSTDIKEAIISVPAIEEQDKIGSFFKQLDKTITLHQRKLDLLKEQKKGYLQKMFPKNGAKVPELRFAGFADDWELRKLGEVGTVAMCRRIFKEQTSEHGEIPFYKIGTFGGPPDAFIARELFEEFKDKYSYPNIGDILISASGSIGRAVEFLGEDEYFQDSNIVWLKHDGKINNIFLKQFYSIVKWSGIEGSTIKRLYNENILNTEIALPTLPEQEAIGTFFSTLDQQITLHQRKLDKLKSVKQAYLSEMFPAEGERVPKRRFPGFTDDWELRKLGEVVYRSNLISSSKDLPRLEFEDINSGLGTLNKDISQKLDDRKGLEFNVGDVLFGKLRPYLKNWWYAEFKGIALGDFWNLKSDLWHSCFLYTYIQSNSFQLVANDTSGTKMPRSDWNLVAESIAKFPSLPEQEVIGTFFSTLDRHITLHQRKSI